MRRPLVTSSCALALALLPAALLAQTPPAQPAQPTNPQPATQQPPASTQPGTPRLSFTSEAGIVLIQIKADQTAVFEELVAKTRQALAKSTDANRKQQAASWKVYKAAEPGAGGNALYVFVVDPAIKGVEYDLFMLLREGLGAEATPEMYKRFTDAFAAGLNKLTLTPLGTMAEVR